MQVKDIQTCGAASAATIVDSEALGVQISELESLYNT